MILKLTALLKVFSLEFKCSGSWFYQTTIDREAYIATNNFDIVCLSDTFLDSSISSDEDIINTAGYWLSRADHPCNMKKGGVCNYYKNFLPLIKKDDITDLKECLVTEITVDNEKCSFTCLYRSPSQNCDQFL